MKPSFLSTEVAWNWHEDVPIILNGFGLPPVMCGPILNVIVLNLSSALKRTEKVKWMWVKEGDEGWLCAKLKKKKDEYKQVANIRIIIEEHM